MIYIIAFKLKNGLPVASRLLRYPAAWHRTEALANARFTLGNGWSLTVKGRS